MRTWRTSRPSAGAGAALDQSEGLYERTVRLFNAAVRGQGAPTASGEDGLRSLLVANAALQSAREGRMAQVSYPV